MRKNMAQIVIRTSFPASAALSCASASCGELNVPLSSDQIALLTDAQRAALAKYSQPDDYTPSHFADRLSVAGPGLAGIVAALDARAASDAAEAATRQANVDAELAQLRAGTRTSGPYYTKDLPEAETLWAEHLAREEAARVAAVLAADAALGEDPAAHVTADGVDDATIAVLTAARVYRDHAYVEVPPPPRALAVRALSERLRAERAEAYAQACRAYVVENVPEYRRAAEEGHDVRAIAAGHVTLLAKRALATVGPVVSCYKDGGARDCPSADAYAVLDAARALDLTVPGIVRATGAEIVRIDVSPHSTAAWRTAVEVELEWADGTGGSLHVLADPAGLPPEEDDESDDEE